MKILIIVIFSLFCSKRNIAQPNSTLIGSWKAVGANYDHFYVNKKLDSTYMSPELNAQFPDSSSKVEGIKSIYGMVLNVEFSFDEHGYFKARFDSTNVRAGKYSINERENIVSLIYQRKNGSEKITKMKFKFDDEFLHLSNSEENERKVIFILAKEE